MRGGVLTIHPKESIGGIKGGASQAIRDEKGTSFTSSMSLRSAYDSRDHFVNPSEGVKSAFATKFAGMARDNRFIKTDLSGAEWIIL